MVTGLKRTPYIIFTLSVILFPEPGFQSGIFVATCNQRCWVMVRCGIHHTFFQMNYFKVFYLALAIVCQKMVPACYPEKQTALFPKPFYNNNTFSMQQTEACG